MIVGTHSVLQSDVEFYDLGLAVIDEEHKFGVIQRDSIIEKSKNGIHIINMSATPIPRSLTNVIVTDSIDIYRVMTMPKGRKQVKTTVYNDKDGIHRFEYFEIQKGHQIYVVCPLVSESEYMDGVLSAETCYQEYCQVFQPFNIRVAMLNGQMKKEEIKKTIAEYAAGKIHILIATTVIEVGVNVPNASTIVVNNAERFGLAGLHQLRGRVGRGNEQGYCILNSAEKNNERLQALCQYSNGFDIAEADLKLRGPGNIIGTEQSGDDYFIRLIMMYPEFYQKYKKKDMCMEDGFAQEYEKFFVLTSAFRKKMLDTL
jgi:ATP-dependent DNA helicase RecG